MMVKTLRRQPLRATNHEQRATDFLVHEVWFCELRPAACDLRTAIYKYAEL